MSEGLEWKDHPARIEEEPGGGQRRPRALADPRLINICAPLSMTIASSPELLAYEVLSISW